MKYEKIYYEDCYGKHIRGYKCDKGFIEKYIYNITANGNDQYDYRLQAHQGAETICVFSTLKEVKAYLETK